MPAATNNAGLASSAGTNPKISVHKDGTDQTGVVTVTFTKVTWPVESYDTNSDFASDRFTPQVAGKYAVVATVRMNAIGDAKSCIVAVYKNGVEAHRKEDVMATAGQLPAVPISVHIEMNGSTDYLEIFVRHNQGSDGTIVGSEISTYWMASRLPED